MPEVEGIISDATKKPAPLDLEQFKPELRKEIATFIRCIQSMDRFEDDVTTGCETKYLRFDTKQMDEMFARGIPLKSPDYEVQVWMDGVSLGALRAIVAALTRLKDAEEALEKTAWKPIETAPKSDANRVVYIMITDGVCVPDIVTWHARKPERTDRLSGTRYTAVPEGWFTVLGPRSRFCHGKARFWRECEAPEALARSHLQPDSTGEKA